MRFLQTLFLIIAISISSLTWGASDGVVAFQKVYEMPEMSASEIKEAFGDPTIDVGMDTMSKVQDVMDTASGKRWLTGLNEAKTGKLRCNIAPASWLPSVNDWANADVAVQIKDGKARVTVANLDVNGPGRKTCIKSIEKHLDDRFSLVKKLGNDW